MDMGFFENVQSQIISLMLWLNALAISKYRKIQKNVASLVKIVKYWAFLSESGITTWCLCVWYTHRAMFVERAVKLFLSTSGWLDIRLLWKSGSGPLSAVFSEWSHLCLCLCHHLKHPFQESVCSFSLNVWLFRHLGSTLLLVTPQQNLGAVYNSWPQLCMWSFSSADCTSGLLQTVSPGRPLTLVIPSLLSAPFSDKLAVSSQASSVSSDDSPHLIWNGNKSIS